MADGQVVFEIRGDDSKINSTIKNVTNTIENESRKWDDSANKTSNDMGNAFAGMFAKVSAAAVAAKVGKELLEWGKAAIDVASDLQEVQNVVDTVFGDGAATIESWSKAAGKQFGLTELQAKKFTSTLGAMMKSSGLAGDQITEMSTDLAGLAADMASFYNLDFETAFEKIRAGISGETMPLKQLGINMSAANLEAFALAQGLEKTYAQMDQGEQTMLRYQYLMQATADAQGDFAKTADGYANTERRIQTSLDSIQAATGEFLLGVMAPLKRELANFLELFASPEERTIMDDLNDIAAEKDTKIANIKAVAAEAEQLIGQLNTIAGSDPGVVMEGIANGANVLDAKSPSLWRSLLSSLRGVDGLNNLFGDESNAADNISALASALSGASVDQTVADAWSTLLTALGSNEEALTTLTQKSPDEAKAWLSGLASAANELDPNSADGWSKLFAALIAGMPGLQETEEGKTFLQSLAANYLALGNESDIAREGLAALGFETDDITKAQTAWLDTCKRLVEIIPGLSSIINTETGEIKGGVQAVQDYVDAWTSENILKAKIEAYKTQREKLNQELNVEYETKVGKAKAAAVGKLMGLEGMTQAEAETALAQYQQYKNTAQYARRQAKDGNAVQRFVIGAAANQYERDAASKVAKYSEATVAALDEYTAAASEARVASEYLPKAIEYMDEQLAELESEVGDVDQAMQDLADSEGEAGNKAKELSDKEKEAAKVALQAAKDAAKAVSDYYENMWNTTYNSVSSAVNGFQKAQSAGAEMTKKNGELAKEEADALSKYSEVWAKWGSDDASLKKMKEFVDAGGKLTDTEYEAYEALVKVRNAQDELNASMKQYTATGMQENLQSQLDYMDEYLQNLETLESWELSPELLAFLSDGSAESAEYLKGLIAGGPEAAAEVDRLYQQVQEKKNSFTDTLTQNRLAADATFDALTQKAMETVAALNLSGEAENAIGQTVEGIAEGIRKEIPEVASEVDALIAELDRLSRYGMYFGFDAGGEIEFFLNGSFEKGLDYVPFDGFLAELHEGEGILTAEENRIWQRFKNGEASHANVDYEALGGVMRDNVKAGGNVYLDGRTVGHVISDAQGRSYRALQRSGWQG